MQYSTFIPDRPSDPDVAKFSKMREDYIKTQAESLNLTLLKSDYFGMDCFYYHDTEKILYKVDNGSCYLGDLTGSVTPAFRICEDPHILQLNGIS